MRYIFLFMILSCVNSSYCQAVNEGGGAANESLLQMQEFIQKNESLKVADTVKRQNLYRELKSFIAKHPVSENNFLFISWGLNLSRPQVDTLMSLVDSSIYNSPQKAWADVTIHRMSVAETGKPFPSLKLVDTAGNELLLSDLKGKIVLLDVWSSWCGPCREQIPGLRKLYKKYNSKGFEIIGISMDSDKQSWLKAIRDDKQTWKAYCELANWRANKFAIRFSVYGIPANFLIDENGVLAAQDVSPEALKNWLVQHNL